MLFIIGYPSGKFPGNGDFLSLGISENSRYSAGREKKASERNGTESLICSCADQTFAEVIMAQYQVFCFSLMLYIWFCTAFVTHWQSASALFKGKSCSAF